MDIPHHLFEGNIRQRAIQAQLLELFKTDPVLDTRQFLVDHVSLLSAEAIKNLDSWGKNAAELGNDQVAYFITRHKLMLDTIWLICVEAPLEIPAIYKSFPELAVVFQEAGIDSLDQLMKQTEEKPQLRESLSQTALRFLTEIDWAIVLVLSKVRSGDELDTIWVAEECPSIVSEEGTLSLNILLDWAQKRELADLEEAIKITLSTIKLVRRNLGEGDLELYEPRIRRLVVQYLETQSWDEAKRIIIRYQDDLLSDQGLGVMRSMLSKTIGNLMADADIYPLGYHTEHLAILEQCKAVGINAAFQDKPIPDIPLELWAIAGLLRIGKPSARTWSGFQENLAKNQMIVGFQAKLVYAALFEARSNNDVDFAAMAEAPVREIELETLKRLAALQFALRTTPKGLVNFIFEEPIILEAKTLDLLKWLLAYLDEREAGVSTQTIIGLYSLLRSPYSSDLISALSRLDNERINTLLPNGADLATLAGGIVVIAEQDSDIESLRFMRQFPAIASKKAVQLVTFLTEESKHISERLVQKLHYILPLITEATEVGPAALLSQKAVSQTEFGSISAGTQSLLEALFVWSTVSSYEEMYAAVERHPILLSDEALSMIENMIDTSKPEQDVAFFEELIGESISQERHIGAIEQMARRYAILLDARREKREKESGFRLRIPDVPDSEYAAQLIRRLEITIQAKLWTPVSRIDLTATFFAILESWKQQVTERFGSEVANLLQNVTIQTKHWSSEFGDLHPEHTKDLEQALQALLDEDEIQNQLRFIQEHPQLLHEAAEDILQDWLITVQVSVSQDAALKIEKLIDLLEQCRRTSSEIVANSKKQGKFQDEEVEFYEELLGGHPVKEFADIAQALLNMSQDQQIDLIEKMARKIETDGAPNATDLSRRIRLLGLKVRLDKAIESGLEALKSLYETEPLLYDPDTIELMKEWGYSSAVIENHEKLVQIFSDPHLKASRQQQLSPAQEDDLENLFELVKEYYLADNWREKFNIVKNNPVLLSNRALLLGDFLENEVSNWLLSPEQKEAFQSLFSVSKNYLLRCREVAPETAAAEQMRRQLTGSVPDAFGSGELNDLFIVTASLPLDLLEELSAAQEISYEEYIRVLEGIANSADLEPSLSASLYAMVGLHYKAQFENGGQLNNLSNAIKNYLKSLEGTDNSSPQYARRLNWLAVCLISRFTDFGHNSQDIDEAIDSLRKALSISLLEDHDLAQIYGHLGLALKTRAEAFSRMSDVEQAIKAYETAISYASPESEPWLGWHMNLANAWSIFWDQYQDLHALEHANQVLEKVIPYAEKGSEMWWGLQYSQAQILLDQGKAENVANKFYAAIEIFRTLMAENPPKPKQAMTHSAIGHALRSLFKLTNQKKYLDEAVNACSASVELTPRDLPDWVRYSNSLAITLGNRYECFRDPNDFEAAMEVFESAISMPFSNSWPHLLIDTAENFGNLCWEQGNYALARQSYVKVLEFLELMRRTAMTEDKVDYSREYVRVYTRIVSCYLMLGDHAKAWEYASAAKARAFVDTLASSPFEIDISDPKLRTLLAEVDTIQIRLQHLRGVITGEMSPPNQVAGSPQQFSMNVIRSEIDQLLSREAAIWKAIRHEYPQYAATRLIEPLDAQSARGLADDLNATIVEFNYDALGWGAFIITRQNIRHIRLSSQEPPWKRWIQSMFNLDDNTHKNIRSFNKALREMYDFFFLLLEANLPPEGSKIVLVQTEFMNSFPLAAALKPDGRYLLDDYIIGMSPGLDVLNLIRGKSWSRGYKRLLSVEYPGQRDEHGYLTYVSLETATIASYFETSLRLKDEGATTSSIIEQAPNHNVIHFACHGFFDWRRPDASGLILPGGSWLTVPDIFNRIRLSNASLVFLSACDVGQEYVRHGDEHISLIRSFMYAGAPVIIAGLWSVVDLSTMLLATRFYKELKGIDGKNCNQAPAKALSLAQRWLRDASRNEILLVLENFKQQLWGEGQKTEANQVREGMAYLRKMGDPPFTHPYYWAAFHAVGDVF